MKHLIENALNNYKQYWLDNKVDFDYEINEAMVSANEFGKDMVKSIIDIRMGIRRMPNKICIIRDEYVYDKNNKHNWNYQIMNRQYERIALQLMTSGVGGIYKDTVMMYRNKQIDNNGVPFGHNPLTPDECFCKK